MKTYPELEELERSTSRNEEFRGGNTGGFSNQNQPRKNKGGQYNNSNFKNDKQNQKNFNQNKKKSFISNQKGNNEGNKQGMRQKQNNAYETTNNAMNNEISMMPGMNDLSGGNLGGYYPTVNMNMPFRGNPGMGFVQPGGYLPPQGMYMAQTPVFNNRSYGQVYPYPQPGFPYQQMG